MVVAGVGNVLRGDDGFGVVVAQRLLDGPRPQEVKVMDVGIGGIHLVQELLEPVDALVIVDALDIGKAPGTVIVMEPEVTDVAAMSLTEKHDQLADIHYAVPARALMLAKGLDVLPPTVFVVGVQAANIERYVEGLSAEVERAIEPAIEETKRIARDLGVEWN